VGSLVVFFDIGSTLIDGPAIGPGAQLAKRLDLGPDVVPELSQRLFTSTYSGPAELSERLATQYDLEYSRIVQVVEDLWHSQIADAYPIPGAIEALRRVAGAGFRVAYVSNIWQPFYEGFLRCFPEEARAFPSYLSFQLGLSKPCSAIFEAALADCGCCPDQTVMIGDTAKHDVAPAIVLGMRTVWILHRPNKEVQDLTKILNKKAAPPDLTLATISDLQPEHLLEMARCQTT
jgi:HAD superfamily hydrolase (TIGR01549 family)